jgi:hypothetical protein
MPWKECHVMDERLRFVARLLEGEKMIVLSKMTRCEGTARSRLQVLFKTDCGVLSREFDNDDQ